MAGNVSNISNGSVSSEDESNWRAVESVAFNFQTYYLWIIFALGFPGNCATIVTVIKMSPARSLTVYITLLAVVDNLSILNKLLMFILPDSKVPLGPYGCKILGYFGNYLITFANWLLVAMSVERFAAVWFPFKVGRTWTFKKSIIAVILLAVPLALLFTPLLWTMTFIIQDGDFFCDVYEEYRYFMAHIWFWINVMIYAAIPCVLLLVFNLLIVAGIVRSGRQQKLLKGSQRETSKNSPQERHRQITIMLVSAAVALLVLTSPRCAMLIISAYWNPPFECMDGAVKYLLDVLAFFLCDLTHAINFYVYSLSAKRFRKQFQDLVLCRKNKMAPMHTQYVSVSRASVKMEMTPVNNSEKPLLKIGNNLED